MREWPRLVLSSIAVCSLAASVGAASQDDASVDKFYQSSTARSMRGPIMASGAITRAATTATAPTAWDRCSALRSSMGFPMSKHSGASCATAEVTDLQL